MVIWPAGRQAPCRGLSDTCSASVNLSKVHPVHYREKKTKVGIPQHSVQQTAVDDFDLCEPRPRSSCTRSTVPQIIDFLLSQVHFYW